jgi:hypothetical protein
MFPELLPWKAYFYHGVGRQRPSDVQEEDGHNNSLKRSGLNFWIVRRRRRRGCAVGLTSLNISQPLSSLLGFYHSPGVWLDLGKEV